MTTQPVSLNFWLYPHATFSELQTLRDGNGALVDLTGYTALMHVRRERGDAVPVLTLSSTSGSIVLGGTAGTIQLVLPATLFKSQDITVDVDGETWWHDILLTDTTASPPVVDRIYQGAVFVMPGITVPP